MNLFGMALVFVRFQHGWPDWRRCPQASAIVYAPASVQISAPNKMLVRHSPLLLAAILCTPKWTICVFGFGFCFFNFFFHFCVLMEHIGATWWE